MHNVLVIKDTIFESLIKENENDKTGERTYLALSEGMGKIW